MLRCPQCLNEEVTCEVTIINTVWRCGAPSHQCLLCAGAYEIVIVRRFDPELGMFTHASDIRYTGKIDKSKGWFSAED